MNCLREAGLASDARLAANSGRSRDSGYAVLIGIAAAALLVEYLIERRK